MSSFSSEQEDNKRDVPLEEIHRLMLKRQRTILAAHDDHTMWFKLNFHEAASSEDSEDLTALKEWWVQTLKKLHTTHAKENLTDEKIREILTNLVKTSRYLKDLPVDQRNLIKETETFAGYRCDIGDKTTPGVYTVSIQRDPDNDKNWVLAFFKSKK